MGYWILTAERRWLAIYWLARYLEILLAAILVKSSKLKVKSLLSALGAGIVFSVGLGAAQMFLGRTTGWFWQLGERSFTLATPGVATMTVWGREILRPYATFSHPNALAGFLAVGFWLMWEKGRRTRRVRGTGGIINAGRIAAAIGVILTGSRGAFAALFVTALLKVPAFASRSSRRTGLTGRFSAGRRSSKFKVQSLLLILGILGILAILGLSGISGNAARFADESTTERLGLAQAAGKMWRENWLMGVGPGQFLVKLPDYLPGGFYKIQPVHNIFLLVLAEFGILGMAIMVIMVIKVIKSAGGASGAGLKWLPVLAVIFITGMGDHYWLTAQQNRLLLGVILGMMMRIRSEKVGLNRQASAKIGLRIKSDKPDPTFSDLSTI